MLWWLWWDLPGAAVFGIGSPAIVCMYVLFNRARRSLQPDAHSLMVVDDRPPILFLRSFSDDKVYMSESASILGIPVVSWLRMEEGLAPIFRDFGPFIAVGEPSEGLPQLGAARAYLPEEGWQEAVLAWIRSSHLVVMLVGPTTWIRWELENVLREQKFQRLLLLLPPRGHRGQLELRWNNVVDSIAEPSLRSAISQIDVRNVLLIQYTGGKLFIFRNTFDLAQDYELALILGIYNALGSAESRPSQIAPSTAPAVAPTIPDWTPSRYGARLIGLWLMAQGIAMTALLAPIVLNVHILFSSRRGIGETVLFGGLVFLGPATAWIGLGVFLKRHRDRTASLLWCVVGMLTCLVFAFEIPRIDLGQLRPELYFSLIGPFFGAAYAVAVAIFWRWRALDRLPSNRAK
jgi:hypothetical protein